ncbi:hypothetical protein PoB_002449100 [Plakobranchus ocellatus]|uniref:Uncharacterized protein n=1 Tax=Plakobranchus ocellatus TaxID=259542 RepID=A0AAV3ZFK8_9GAST|nr:hypothetical protein PoB_002449100 [Plakobranchus ocellatus]
MKRNAVSIAKYTVGSTVLIISGVCFLHMVNRIMVKRPVRSLQGEPIVVVKRDPYQSVPDPTMRAVSNHWSESCDTSVSLKYNICS